MKQTTKVTQKERAKIKAEIRAEIKKKKLTKCDGLGPYEVKKIREALRVVWHRSLARKLVVDRCTDGHGFTRCENCGKRTPTLKVDHMEQCGDVDEGFIKRLFCPSEELWGLCKPCHDIKTKAEKEATKVETAFIRRRLLTYKDRDWGF